MLKYLFFNYGKFSTRLVKEKEQEVLSASFVPSDPMVTIFHPIEQLRTLTEIAIILFTDKQIVDLGIQLIKNTRYYKTVPGNWNKNQNRIKHGIF